MERSKLSLVECRQVEAPAPLHQPSPEDAARLFRSVLPTDREGFAVMHLAPGGRVISVELVAQGTLTSVPCHPREVFKGAILANAGAVIVAHNHPWGPETPSKQDRLCAWRLGMVGELVGIEVVACMVVTQDGHALVQPLEPEWTEQQPKSIDRLLERLIAGKQEDFHMSSSGTLMLHAGGWEATPDEIREVPDPERTKTYTPVAHRYFADQVKRALPNFGLHLVRERYGLAREGRQMFAVWDVANGVPDSDWAISIGGRNSYDKSFALHMVAGQRVFVCDNLAFSGEVRLRERHVGEIDERLPALVTDLVGATMTWKGRITAQTNRLKAAGIDDRDAHDVVCVAVRSGIIPATMVPRVLKEWHEPSHEEFGPRVAWSLYNGFTEAFKERSPGMQMGGTISLTRMFNERFGEAEALPETVEAGA